MTQEVNHIVDQMFHVCSPHHRVCYPATYACSLPFILRFIGVVQLLELFDRERKTEGGEKWY